MIEQILPREFRAADGVEDWRVVGDGACAVFRTASFADGARLVAAIDRLGSTGVHRPDVDLRHDAVTVRVLTVTDEAIGLTAGDVELARDVSALARELGLAADPSMVQTVQVTIDALVIADVLPFWRAVLGYGARADGADEDLLDPRGRGAPFWFQQMDAPRRERNRIHIDVFVPAEEAEARVAAALAAGGHLVTDEFAPHWWTLADAEGNEVDVATVEARD